MAIEYLKETCKNLRIKCYAYWHGDDQIDDLVQDCSNSNAIAMELLQSVIKICVLVMHRTGTLSLNMAHRSVRIYGKHCIFSPGTHIITKNINHVNIDSTKSLLDSILKKQKSIC